MACTLCDKQAELPDGYKEASEWVKAAVPLIQQHSGGELLVTEERALGHTFGPFDLVLLLRSEGGELRKLYFDVDGEKHDENYCDMSGSDQWLVDRRKDNAAWRAGMMLVRLHYKDLSFWPQTISQAVAVAQRRQRHRLLLYTKGHGLRGKHGAV